MKWFHVRNAQLQRQDVKGKKMVHQFSNWIDEILIDELTKTSICQNALLGKNRNVMDRMEKWIF